MFSRVDRWLGNVARRHRSLASRAPAWMRASLARGRERSRVGAEERFTFDLQGYLIVKQVLTPGEVAALTAIAEQKLAAPGDRAPQRREFGISSWGPPYQALIDHPRITPYLAEFVGPKFRLDHDYCLTMARGGKPQSLHGGTTSGNPDHWYTYRDGVIRCGLTVVTFVLTPARAGDGGFCCVPGSHKSNFVASIPDDVRRYRRAADYVVQPPVEPGDAIVFAEALVHGTAPWTAAHERLVLLFKYSPGHSAWTNDFYDLGRFTGLTEQQKRILAPPSVGDRPDTLDRV